MTVCDVARSHARTTRTKRNDFPVWHSAQGFPQPPIYIYIYIYTRCEARFARFQCSKFEVPRCQAYPSSRSSVPSPKVPRFQIPMLQVENIQRLNAPFVSEKCCAKRFKRDPIGEPTSHQHLTFWLHFGRPTGG